MWSLRARWWLLRHVGVRAALAPRKQLTGLLLVLGSMDSLFDCFG
jgi:hypothetical protein